MATYKKLLYSVGGGIIGDAVRDAQNGSATIAIGLGGTGKDAIKRLKKEVYQRIRPDNDGESVAKYQHIRYLSIDTDDADLWNEEDFIGIDEDSEFESIKGDVSLFTDENNTTVLANKPYAKWVNATKFKLQSDKGAGGVRQIGRYFLIDKSQAVKEKLKRIFTAAVTGLLGDQVNIHVMTGLGGGTGAGTFLDMCYIIQKAVSECSALNGKTVRICGYFFLPDVNLARIQQDNVRKYIQENSFAVLKELDYCMNFGHNGDSWDQVYNGFSIKTSKPPVDIAYLVSAQSVAGNVNENGYDYAMGVVSDYVIQFMADNSINMDTHIANYSKAQDETPKPHGGNYNYVIIGASHAIVPLREISTYLASLLYGKMAAAWGNEPTDADIADFCAKLGLTSDKLIREMGSHDIAIPEVENDYDKISTDDNGDKYEYGYVLPAPILGPFNTQEQKISGKLKASQEALMNPWEYGMELEDNPKSIVCRVYKELERVVNDPDRGPVYAAKMLMGSDKKNIVNIITGIHQTILEMSGEAVSGIDLTVKGVKAARKAYNERGLFQNKNTLFNGLLAAIRTDIMKRCEATKLTYLCNALETIKDQLIDLYTKFFKKYADVIINIKSTFAENALAIGELQDVNADPFILPLFKISKVRETLRAEVEKINISSEITRFNKAFFNGAYDIWSTAEADTEGDKIAKWMTTYMSDTFKDYLTKSLDEHIKSVYPEVAEDIPRLTAKVRDDVIAVLDQKACELFLLNGAKAQHVAEHSSTLTYCSAPVASSIITAAIKDYSVNHPEVTKVSGSDNRIFVLKSTPCVPLFAYGMIDDNYAIYNSTYGSGIHLYEGNPKYGDSRNWRTFLPNLRPYSIYAHIDWNTPEKETEAGYYGIAENVEKFIHAYVDENGVETGDYYIWVTPDYSDKIVALQSLVDGAESIVVAGGNPSQAKEALDNLAKAKDDLVSYKAGLFNYKMEYKHDPINNTHTLVNPVVEPVRIRNDGSVSDGGAGTDATMFVVRRDHVLASPKLMAIVKDELGKIQAYKAVIANAEACIERLNMLVGEAQDKANLRGPFIEALLSGVIVYGMRHKISYDNKDEFGMGDSVELSKPGDEPYGGKAPLYQAFTAYLALSGEMRATIGAKVTVRLNSDSDQVFEDIKKVLDYLDGVYTADYIQMVDSAVNDSSDKDEILEFYRMFMTNKKNFRVQYGLI